MRHDDIAIVVPSCDKYSDLWKPFFLNLNKKGLNNFLKIYLVTNNADFEYDNVRVIKIGEDLSWSSNLKKALKQIEETIVFLFIDDLFLTKCVNQEVLVYFFNRFKNEKMNYLRFNPTPKPFAPVDKDGIGPIHKGDSYRASTVMCLWDKKVLIDVLKDGESAWELELNGTERTNKYDKWYASSEWLLSTKNLVIKGKCDPIVFRNLRREGLPISDERPIMNVIEYMLFLFIRIRAWLFSLLPRKLRSPIRRQITRFNMKRYM